MAKDMRNGAFLLLLCNIAFFISQFHFGYTSTNPSSFSNNNNVTCIESERRALLEFKATLVDTASRLASWTAGEDCCNWAGITCNPRTGHVQKLHLRNPIQDDSDDYYFINSLGGEINPSILNLEHLTYLDLSCNYFSGIPIPTFLGSLKNLRYLDLYDAGFGGEIPSHLGNLSNLQYLDLGISDSSVSYLTAKSLNWIISLTSLKALDLSEANLIECVDCLYSIGMIPSLSSLSLRHCRIVVGTALSPDLSPIVNLTSLVSLDLGENHLMSNSSILLPLLNLSSQLVVLKLDDNSLQGPIPINLEKLTALTVLDLSYNNFNSSSMPHSLCNDTNLVYLALRFNFLQGSLPLCLGNLTSLRVFDLTSNNFWGKIPNELGDLKQLTTLYLSFNQFNCSIPSSFGQLSKLENLDLSFNQLGGVVPSTLGQLTKLQKLDIFSNHLGGVVPSTLGQLTKLQKLDISYNSLTGELFESHFEKLKSLKYLFISNNYFSLAVSSKWTPPFQLQIIQMDSVFLGSQFPPWLQTQRYVEELSMRNASISGVIPTWFTSWSSVKLLYLSNNKIKGSSISFPPNIWELDLSNNLMSGALSLHANDLTNMPLQYFYLNHNHLVGDIPDTFCNLSSLRWLYLANNQLTGRIPLCFGNLSSLETLSLANNKLTGRIPLSFGNVRGFTGLDLSNNSFSGHIPSTLGSLTSLWVLRLSRNKLSGVLPSSLKNLEDLKTLDLGENQLVGNIPEWIGKKLLTLQFLLLESNNFSGDISMHLCQLSSLQILDLAKNNLGGHIPRCFGNLTMMRSKDAGNFSEVVDISDTLRNVMKGVELEYSEMNLRYAKFISLSTNNLQGEIPNELLDLEGLQSLNLSKNKLSGRIPENIGKLKNLESLDLAMNQLSGPIPQSLANIDTLCFLNLSFNHLVGRIPSAPHFDTFDQSTYEGNSGLCGKPLANSCQDDGTSEGKGTAVDENIDDGFELLWFYAGIAPGFAVGFVGVFCILYFKKSWRHEYFRFVENCFCNF